MDSIARLPQLLMESLRDEPWLWALGGVVLLGLLIAVYGFFRTRSRRRVQRIVQGLGHAVRRNVVVPDSVEGLLHVDYLVLTADGVLLIEIKDYRGMLFGGARTDIWTQVVDGRSYKFDNPLHRNQACAAAVRALVPAVPVRGIVVFTDAGRFPRQRPAGVYMLGQLKTDLGLPDTPVSDKFLAAWEQLQQRLKPQS